MDKSEDGSVHGQGTLAAYEITDGLSVSPTGNTTKGKYQKEEERNEGAETKKTTIGSVPSGRE